MKTLTILFLTFVLVSACKKPEERTCFKFSGKIDSLDIQVESFNELNLGKRLNYNLVPDTINFIRIKGGSNLLRLVSHEVNQGILYIENQNRCDFLRDFSEILEVEIHFVHLNRVEGRISHNLNSLDTIRGTYFNLSLTGASGYANLLVNTEFINGFANDGNADYTFSGVTKYAHIQAHSNGFADARPLKVTEVLEVTSRSNRSIFCHAEGISLIVNIERTGSVYYTGNPSSIVLNKTGTGNLVKLD